MRAPALGANKPASIPGVYSYKLFRIQRPSGTPTTLSMSWEYYFKLLRQSGLNPRALSKVVRAAAEELLAANKRYGLSEAVRDVLSAKFRKATQV